MRQKNHNYIWPQKQRERLRSSTKSYNCSSSPETERETPGLTAARAVRGALLTGHSEPHTTAPHKHDILLHVFYHTGKKKKKRWEEIWMRDLLLKAHTICK